MTSETPRIGWKHPILVGYQDANLPRWCYNTDLWSDVNELNNLTPNPQLKHSGGYPGTNHHQWCNVCGQKSTTLPPNGQAPHK